MSLKESSLHNQIPFLKLTPIQSSGGYAFFASYTIIEFERSGFSMKKLTINMFSSADKVAGQGVGSAYLEQVGLIKEEGRDFFNVNVNKLFAKCDIQHFHTVDPLFYIQMLSPKTLNVAYCHYLPETLSGSVKLPGIAMSIFSQYIVSFYKRADKLVVVNPIFIEDLVGYGVARENIAYIPNYVSKEQFHPIDPEKKKALRQSLGFKESDFIVFDAGQVQTRKGVLDFVEVAKQCPDLQFVWAGGFSFGAITDGYAELKKIVENPPQNVHFIGMVEREKMNDYYNLADVLFMPSYNELFPMTILEAVNVGLPLVLRDLDLYKSILFADYLTANDNEGFVAHLRQLSQDRAAYQKASEQSAKIAQYYSKEHVMEKWKDFYQKSYQEKFNKTL